MTRRGCCYECAAKADGRPPDEFHHALGRKNSELGVLMPANWHRELHARQRRRPEVLRHPADDNPLHLCALVVITLGEAAGALADHASRSGWPGWVAKFARLLEALGEGAANYLLILAGLLEESYGADWFKGVPLWRP